MDSLDRVIEERLAALRRMTAADFAALALCEGGTQSIYWRYASGSRNDRYKRIVLRNGKGVAGNVMRSGRPLILQDFTPQHGDDPSDYSIMLAEDLHAAISFPLIVKDHVIGLLLVGNRFQKVFDAGTLQIVDEAAAQLAALWQAQHGDGGEAVAGTP